MAKDGLRFLGKVPLARSAWLGSVRLMLRSIALPQRWRDGLMWDMATQILGIDYEETLQLATGPRLITGMEDNVTRAVLFLADAPYFIWEPQTLKLALQLQSKDGVTIVAGGHIGYHALHLALARAGQVVAFEPVSKLYQRLTRSVSLSAIQNLTVVRAALDTKSRDWVDMNISGAWSSLASLSRKTTEVRERVEALSLDDYARQTHLARVDLILLDVEGNELNVLLGAGRLLESGPTLILEVTPAVLRQSGLAVTDVYAFLFKHGYSVFGIVDEYGGVFHQPATGPVQVKPLTAEAPEFFSKRKWFNILATRHPQKLDYSNVVVLP